MPEKMNFITLEGLQAFKEESEAQNNSAYASKMTISQNATTGVVTFKLYAEDNTLLDTKTLDLDTEHIIKSVSLDYTNKLLVFTMNDDTTLNCDISDLIDNLSSNIQTAVDNEATTRANEITRVEGLITTEENRAKGVENSKVDKVANATENNIALFDSNGNVKDSGKSINDVGKVATVSVGGGTPIQPDQDKNIDLPAYPTRFSLSINNVDNTSDANKPVSTAQQTAIDSTGHKIDLEIDNTTFKIKAKLYDKNNTLISTSNEIDLPLESVVVSGSYDSVNKKVVLTLQNGTTIEFSVADLIYGLQSAITAQNPLSSDLVDDTGNTHKFVSANDKTKWDNKRDDLYIIELDKKTFDEKVLTAEQLAKINENPYNVVIYETGGCIYRFSKDGNNNYYYYEGDYRFITQNSKLQTIFSRFKIHKTTGAWDFENIIGESQAPITSSNKVNADYIDDSNSNNKFISETEKQKLADLENYDDTEVRGLITTESNRAIKQENKSLLHLGAYDTYPYNSDRGKVLRQTGVVYKPKVNGSYLQYTNCCYYFFAKPSNYIRYGTYTNSDYEINIPKINGSNWDSADNIGKVSGYAQSTNFWVCFAVGTTEAQAQAFFDTLILQYKLATPYTDDGIIEGESLLPLDSNMANKIRQKVVDGLNLLDNSLFVDNKGLNQYGGIISASGYKATQEYIPIKPNTTYTITNGTIYGYKADKTFDDFIYSNTITTKSTMAYIRVEGTMGRDVMLVEANHKYPYSDFNQKEHITNDEATLLKQEEEKCRNLLPNSANVTAQNQTLIFNVNIIAGKTYTFSIQGGTNTNSYSFATQMGNTDVQVVTTGTNVNNVITFTASGNANRVAIYPNNVNNANFMLNEGDHAYPYQEWNGKIIHEKDLEPTLLWENGSPTSAFASQTINVDMTNYKYIIIEYKRISDSAWQETAIKKLGVAVAPSDLPTGFCLSEIFVGDIVYRQVAFKSLTQLTFLSAYYGGEQANGWLIPVKIYGTNIP